MVRNILLLFFVSLFYAGQGQISYNPDPYSIVVANCQDLNSSSKENLELTVVQDTIYTIYWKMEFTNVRDEWQVQLCDLNFCYAYNAPQSSTNPSNANRMENGSYIFNVALLPNGVEGTGKVTLKLYGDNAFTKLIKEIPINLYACTTSAKDVNVSVMKVFPNPSSDYFQISNSSQVSKIVIYNVLGKEVKTLFHYNNASHDIGDLRKGIYMVRLLDSKNKVLKTVRLSKNIDGA